MYHTYKLEALPTYRTKHYITTKIVDYNRIQTWIVRVQGEHADHLNQHHRGPW